jgi:hypothetical protein
VNRLVNRIFASLIFVVIFRVAARPCAAVESVFSPHPAAAQLEQVFAAADAITNFTPSTLKRGDYLPLIARDVDHFKQYQNDAGAIIDPYTKKEVQYSTPAFAVAAGLLATADDRHDLLEPATKALSCSITALVTHHAADGHSDFYIPLVVHAYRILKEAAPLPLREQWENELRQINPNNAYNAQLRLMNWNIVSSSGELLRRKDGLVADDMMDAQLDYLEKSLAGHVDHMTQFGMYEDPNAPLAYDEFARLWLDDMMADQAYKGALSGRLTEFLRTGGLSTLLLLSPSGEWASGGRSAFHNWNEAETVAVCEINANYWNQAHRPDVAGAFKRAAHLAFESMQRWQRPSGELWILKNRAEPQTRLGFETYSYHTQYNLLPMAMLAIAYTRADDSIAERPAPSEVGGYVFDLREMFHKIVAAAGGYYVLIDTSADPHYNSTGLQRVHKSGVAFPPLSDSTAAERAYGPSGGERVAMTPGIQWKQTADLPWIGLGDFVIGHPDHIKSVSLQVTHIEAHNVAFAVDYALDGPGEDSRHIVESYTIADGAVECDDRIVGGSPIAALRVCFPALVNDGAKDTNLSIDGPKATIDNRGSVLTWQIQAPPADLGLALQDPPIPTHNGYVRALIGQIPSTVPEVRWQITMTENPTALP